MRRCIWNRFTVVGTVGLFVGLICIALFLNRSGNGGVSEIMVFPAIAFITGGILTEAYALHRSRRFFAEDALTLYSKATDVIKALRIQGRAIHRDVDHLPDPNARFMRDKRFLYLKSNYAEIKRACVDCRLNTMLGELFDVERLMAKLRFDPLTHNWRFCLEDADEKIRHYIHRNLRSRAVTRQHSQPADDSPRKSRR